MYLQDYLLSCTSSNIQYLNLGKIGMVIFAKKSILSDEYHFYLLEFVNKQNCRILRSANLHIIQEITMHPIKITISCALLSHKITEQIYSIMWFFEKKYIPGASKFMISPLLKVLQNETINKNARTITPSHLPIHINFISN